MAVIGCENIWVLLVMLTLVSILDLLKANWTVPSPASLILLCCTGAWGQQITCKLSRDNS